MRFVFGDCTLDTERYELRRAGQVAGLEFRAFRVLAYLLRHARQAVSKQALVQACWPGPSSEAISQEYALRNCLMKIRQAVGDTGTQRAVIETVRGYGYRVTAAVTVLPSDALAAGTMPQNQVNDPMPPAPSAPARVLPERRQLTVLCCALVEDPSWARRDPEDMQMVLQAFYTACEKVIQRVEGYIAQYDSGGLLVYFGYPMADEALPSAREEWSLLSCAPLRVRAVQVYGGQGSSSLPPWFLQIRIEPPTSISSAHVRVSALEMEALPATTRSPPTTVRETRSVTCSSD